MCDNTTRFSKWIVSKKPHLADYIGVCSAHLTGIAWQKKTQSKYFDSAQKYKAYYRLVVRATRCSSVSLATVVQRAIVRWLRERGEAAAADWFETYWTGRRGNWTLAHGGIAGTNNNNGTEGNWGGMKKAVLGTSCSTSGLAVRAVVPSLMRFLSDKSKEEASFWRKATRARALSSMFSFPAIPVPIKAEWDHFQKLHPRVLQFSRVVANMEIVMQWEAVMMSCPQRPRRMD